ncbi:hypothetical protein G6M50_06105 [Agrobacterium rhizogenes]|nr:hypothetical protein [Rhizobium rhizogenes]NTJ77375.1 hypothetical protein [Rhizobium rhizogenes]
MSNGIQSSVTTQPAVGVVGDFATANPRFSQLAGPGAIVAGPSGLVIGRFAWLSYSQIDGDNAPAAANNFGTGPVAGFVGRAQQGLITTYLTAYGMTIPAGFQATLFSGGDFWALNSGASAAQVGMKAYANFADGSVTFAAAGSPTTGQATTSAIAAGTAATGTGTIVGNVLTIASVSNTIFVGALVTGTNVATGTTIVSQLSGTAGGAGTYAVDIPNQSVASTSLTLTPYVLDTTGGTVTGTIAVNGIITSAGTPSGGVVVGKSVASAYAAGKWVIASKGATSASGTVVIASNVETSWHAASFGANGEIVKISNVPGIG